jgi:uncharacterized coiled-coil protein SlyX
MQPSSHPNEPIASIEQHLVDLEYTLERQSISIARLQDELAEANRRADWYHVQFSELMRILARDMRELRATLICSVVSDGPISAQVIEALLRQTPDDVRELEAPVRPLRYHHGN